MISYRFDRLIRRYQRLFFIIFFFKNFYNNFSFYKHSRSRSPRDRKRRKKDRRRSRSRSESRSDSDRSRSGSRRRKRSGHKSHKSSRQKDRHGNKRSRKGKSIFTDAPEKPAENDDPTIFDPEHGFALPKNQEEELKRQYMKPAPCIRPADPTSTNRCFRCLLKGHRADVCPNEARCRGCRRVGHLEAECPEKPENKAIIEAEKKMAEKEKRRNERRARHAEKQQELDRMARRSRTFDKFYYRSNSPEAETQRQNIVDDESGNLRVECGHRTAMCMQLHPSIKARDLYSFFGTIGKVNEVKVIYDKFSRRSRGIAYIEFRDPMAMGRALTLTNQQILGYPIIVQPSNADRNQGVNQAPVQYAKATIRGEPLLQISNLHQNITEEMLSKVFEPFGVITKCEVAYEKHTGRSKGHAEIIFSSHESANKAKEALNGFELAGRTMQVISPEDYKKNLTMQQLQENRQKNMNMGVNASFEGVMRNWDQEAQKMQNNNNPNGSGSVSQPGSANSNNMTMAPNFSVGGNQAKNLDSDMIDKGGVALDGTQRLKLMAKLAAGTGMDLPEHAKAQLQADQNRQEKEARQASIYGHATTPCFQLANLFNPKEESGSNWWDEIRDDVLYQCNGFGGICHISVDTQDENGIVFLKAPSIAVAAECVGNLHGRFFGGRTIKASYIPLQAYHYKFPDSVNKNTPIVLADA